MQKQNKRIGKETSATLIKAGEHYLNVVFEFVIYNDKISKNKSIVSLKGSGNYCETSLSTKSEKGKASYQRKDCMRSISKGRLRRERK